MAKLNKKSARLRRAGRARHKIRRLGVNRLTIYRSASHMYAQVFSPCGATVLVSASSLDKEIKTGDSHCGNVKTATKVGELLAQRCKKAGVEKVAFDRSGCRYHGRVKALAEAAREGGIQF